MIAADYLTSKRGPTGSVVYLDDYGFPVHVDAIELGDLPEEWRDLPDRDLEWSNDRLLDAPTTDLFGRDYNRHYYGGA